jgi:hypothetical protein
MMLALAFSSIIIEITQLSCYSYYFLTTNTLKSNYAKIVAVFVFQLSNILLYINYSKSFYIYTLTSSLYRKILRETILRYYRRLLHIIELGNQQNIQPTNIRPTINQIT